MIEDIISAFQDAINSETETLFELKQFKKDIYLVVTETENHRPLYKMKLEYTDKTELCNLIYSTIKSAVAPHAYVNFIEHLCCGFGNTIHTDIWIELNENVTFGIFDRECNFQEWIQEMYDKDTELSQIKAI